MRGKLSLAVSVMMLAVQIGSPLAAEPNVEQLSEIQEMLARNDIAELRTYLQDNPDLLEGDTRLALLLRRFFAESRNLTSYLSDRSELRSTLRAASEGPDRDNDLFEEGSNSDEVEPEPEPEPDAGEGGADDGPVVVSDEDEVDSIY
jgi:hypothetical protein